MATQHGGRQGNLVVNRVVLGMWTAGEENRFPQTDSRMFSPCSKLFWVRWSAGGGSLNVRGQELCRRQKRNNFNQFSRFSYHSFSMCRQNTSSQQPSSSWWHLWALQMRLFYVVVLRCASWGTLCEHIKKDLRWTFDWFDSTNNFVPLKLYSNISHNFWKISNKTLDRSFLTRYPEKCQMFFRKSSAKLIRYLPTTRFANNLLWN